MSIVRRVGARLLKLLRNETGDPATDPTRVQVYAKDVSGTGRLFARDTNGDITQLSGGGGGGGGVDALSQPAPANGPAPGMQFQFLKVAPDGSRVFVGGQGSSETWRFSTTTNKWITAPPAALALEPEVWVNHPSGLKAYLVLASDRHTIYIFDLTTDTITGTITGLPVAGFSYGAMAIQPGTNELWAHYDTGPNFIARIDTSTDTYITSFTAATGNSNDMTFNASGTKMYYIGLDTLSFGPRFHIYDATTYTLITSINDTLIYRGLIAVPSDNEVWVAIDGNFPTNSSFVRYDTTTDSPVGSPILTSQDSGAPFHIVKKSDDSTIYALLFSGDIDVIDVATHAVTNTIAMSGDFAGSLAIHPDDSKLYASKTQGTQPYWVKVISTATELVTDTVYSDSVAQPSPTTVGTFDALRFVGARVTDDGGGQGVITPPVVYDTSVPAFSSIKANRPAPFQSLNDQTKSGITNFGVGGVASGANATIGGGINGVASGDSSCVPGGDGAIASGEAAFATGSSEASGDWSTAMGGSIARGDYSTALGESLAEGYAAISGGECGAPGDYSLSMGGYGSDASGETATAIGGYGNNANGEAAFACGGFGSSAEGDGSFAANEGFADGQNSASFSDSRSQGDSSFAANAAQINGLYAAGFNRGNTGAAASYAFAAGDRSLATRIGQRSHAGGRFSADGDAQESIFVMRGNTPGGGAGESTELVLPSQFILEDNKAYAIVVSAVANGQVSGSPNVQMYKQSFAVRRTAGLTTIAQAGTQEQLGDAASSSWTFVASVGAGPDRLALTFNTGATTSAARVVAKVEFVEVLN